MPRWGGAPGPEGRGNPLPHSSHVRRGVRRRLRRRRAHESINVSSTDRPRDSIIGEPHAQRATPRHKPIAETSIPRPFAHALRAATDQDGRTRTVLARARGCAQWCAMSHRICEATTMRRTAGMENKIRTRVARREKRPNSLPPYFIRYRQRSGPGRPAPRPATRPPDARAGFTPSSGTILHFAHPVASRPLRAAPMSSR
jgi:hypothetical protein